MEEGFCKALRVLVVDDSPIDRIYHAALLGELGHQPGLASDAWEALEMLGAVSFDAVLMDMRLPDMDALGALRCIRALPPPACKVPVIMVTALLDKEDRKRCLEAGALACLAKPLEASDLAAALSGLRDGAAASGAAAHPAQRKSGTGSEEGHPLGRPGRGGAALCRDFIAELDVKQAAMVRAMEQERWGEVAGLAHALAGGAAILGLRSLVAVARRLDHTVFVVGRRLDNEDLAAMFAAMQEARQLVEAWLEER